MNIRGVSSSLLIAVVATVIVAGCRSDPDAGSGPWGTEVDATEEVIDETAGSEPEVPESNARVVASLPESSVVVIDPDAGSRSERVEELAESVGASLEGDRARIVLEESVLFEFGSAELLLSAADILDDIAELLTELSADQVDVVGHTDAVGSDEYNLDLSARRAGAVEAALVDRGIGEDTLAARGAGEAEPVALNQNADGTDNPEGRARNRRVEVTASGIAD